MEVVAELVIVTSVAAGCSHVRELEIRRSRTHLLGVDAAFQIAILFFALVFFLPFSFLLFLARSWEVTEIPKIDRSY